MALLDLVAFGLTRGQASLPSELKVFLALMKCGLQLLCIVTGLHGGRLHSSDTLISFSHSSHNSSAVLETKMLTQLWYNLEANPTGVNK